MPSPSSSCQRLTDINTVSFLLTCYVMCGLNHLWCILSSEGMADLAVYLFSYLLWNRTYEIMNIFTVLVKKTESDTLKYYIWWKWDFLNFWNFRINNCVSVWCFMVNFFDVIDRFLSTVFNSVFRSIYFNYLMHIWSFLTCIAT